MLYDLLLTFAEQQNYRHKNTKITEAHNVELHELYDITKEKGISNLLVLLKWGRPDLRHIGYMVS